MMTQQLHVSILAAPLAAIDSRTLSQAWYSALRLSRGAPAIAQTAGRCVNALRPHARIVTVAPREAGRQPGVVALRGARDTNGEVRASADFANHRTTRTPLARRIERTFGVPTPPQRATFSLGHDTARVHVILQTSGGRSTLVALCRPELEAVVSRALALAGRALAARGIAIEIRARGVARCS